MMGATHITVAIIRRTRESSLVNACQLNDSHPTLPSPGTSEVYTKG